MLLMVKNIKTNRNKKYNGTFVFKIEKENIKPLII